MATQICATTSSTDPLFKIQTISCNLISMQQQLFRKKALERLSSPEQLDQLMQVTNARAWLGFVGLSVILIIALLWSIFGSIPTKVSGRGILIRSGGVYEVVALGAGRVTEIPVRPGDRVEKGQIVARVAQPELLDAIETAQEELEALKNQQSKQGAYVTKDLAFQRDLLLDKKRNAEATIRTAAERVNYFHERIQVEEGLLKKGLITEKQLLATKDDLSRKEEEITTARGQLKELSVQELALTNKAEQQITDSGQKIADQERRIQVLKNQLELASRVVSEQTGMILEVRTDVGRIVTVGTPLVSLESAIRHLEALFYISPSEGKKVQSGMDAQVALSTVKKEEFGMVLAKVTFISKFPSSNQAMMRILGNESLVQTLSASGAPFEVRADLIPDPNTESGFKWTSAGGAPVQIFSGTLCTGLVTVRQQRPITLLIPFIREKLGV